MHAPLTVRRVPSWGPAALAASAVSLGLLVSSPSPAQEPPPSIEEICRVIGEQRAKLQSLDIELATEEHTTDPALLLKWLSRVGLHNGKERFAFKGNKRY